MKSNTFLVGGGGGGGLGTQYYKTENLKWWIASFQTPFWWEPSLFQSSFERGYYSHRKGGSREVNFTLEIDSIM